ncbi:MAG TPA: hypothetical protein VGD65_26685 [Chryseosolibacter sp.]
MAKSAPKSAAKTTKNAPAKTSKPKTSAPSIEKASEEALEKLRSLGIEQELQNDIEWCLGSYRADGNPVGLYAAVERAVSALKGEKEKKTKGVTAKLITDLEKSLESK